MLKRPKERENWQTNKDQADMRNEYKYKSVKTKDEKTLANLDINIA